MNRSDRHELIQNALQGRLTAEEQRRFEESLTADPEFRAAYDEERALEQLIEALPAAPVASNFTARVMQEVQRETKRGSERRSWWRWSWRPALATSILAIAVGGLFYQQQRKAAREELAESLSQFSEVTSSLAAAASAAPEPEIEYPPLPPVTILEDFQAIQHLAHMPAEQEQDLELYLALHK